MSDVKAYFSVNSSFLLNKIEMFTILQMEFKDIKSLSLILDDFNFILEVCTDYPAEEEILNVLRAKGYPTKLLSNINKKVLSEA